jgi:hypothetical protein
MSRIVRKQISGSFASLDSNTFVGNQTITGSVFSTGSLWNIVTSEFQVVTNPSYFTNDFFLLKNQFNEFKMGATSTDVGFTISSSVASPFIINNTNKDILSLTNSGTLYLSTQSSFPSLPPIGGLLFSGSDFFVSL